VLQGAAGVLYFWSFMILVFMILLNFLLAIIVDAFSEIKNATKERTGGWRGSIWALEAQNPELSRKGALHDAAMRQHQPVCVLVL
jgi:hypothetical protein